ncbi:MAG: zinc ribbon domain-containing protein [Ruthenibacterium sp.]
MKLCSICGAQAQDTDTFCSACGSQLEPTVLNAPEAPENPISAVAQTEAAAEQKTDDLDESPTPDAEKMNMPEAPHPLNQSCAHAQADVTPDGTQQATAEPKTDDLEENSASDAEKINMPKVPHPLYHRAPMHKQMAHSKRRRARKTAHMYHRRIVRHITTTL